MKKNKTRDDLYMEDVPQNTKATVRRLLSRLGRQKGRLLVVHDDSDFSVVVFL